MAGMTKDLPGVHWYVIPIGGAETSLPRGKLQVQALAGLETGLAEQALEVSNSTPAEIAVKLPFLFHPEASGLVATAKEPGRVQLTHEVRVDAPAWFAVRIDSGAKNEFAKTLFAHGSPVFVTMKGQKVFDVESAVGLLKQVEEGHAAVKERGKFSSPEAARKTLALYDEAAQELRDRINARR